MTSASRARPLEVILSKTDVAADSRLRSLSQRAAREVLRLEEARLAEVSGTPAHRAVELSVTLTDDEGIRELNRRHLGRDSATDVLAFFMGGNGEEPGPFLLGDVVVSVETARAQAVEYGRPFPEELGRLVAHGTLHLLGFTDESEAGLAAMRAKEDEALTALGFVP